MPETNHSAEGVGNIRDNIKEAALDISKCCEQGYDGASVMRGIHSGPQMLTKQQSLYAECVHCVCHRLTFALNEAANCCAKIISFFETTVEI